MVSSCVRLDRLEAVARMFCVVLKTSILNEEDRGRLLEMVAVYVDHAGVLPEQLRHSVPQVVQILPCNITQRFYFLI